MSDVKKISSVGNIYGWEESEFGEFVLSEDYDALEAEAQALREERDRIERNRDMWKGQCERQAEKLAALRARFVVPDEEESFERWAVIHNLDLTVPPSPGDYESTVTLMAWEAWKERSRLNGKAVSEGLLRRLTVQPPAVCDIEDQWKWQREHDHALDELRDLLGEGKEHE